MPRFYNYLALACLCALPQLASANNRFEPADGKTLLIIGQEKREIADYWKDIGPGGGYMMYTSLRSLTGMDGPTRGSGCSDSGIMDFQDWAANYPGTVAQVGLYMVGSAEDAATGDLDAAIEDLAEIIRKAGRPVMLRIGYEFDGPWNRYHPQMYQTAYRRIVDIMRGKKVSKAEPIQAVPNVAFVWHSAAYDRFDNHPLSAWYPGDEYVDWVGLSWFAWATADDEEAAAEAREAVAKFAKQHRKPLMIGEAAPKAHWQADNKQAWKKWHEPVFRWIETHNVKAYSYINVDWNKMPQWQAGCGNGNDWGDTRLQMPDSTLLDAWKRETAKPRWLKQGVELERAIGFGTQKR